MDEVNGMLLCSMCKQQKPIDQFSRNRAIAGRGRIYNCKPCNSIYRKAHPAANRTGERNRLHSARWRAVNLKHCRAYQAAYHRGYKQRRRMKEIAT